MGEEGANLRIPLTKLLGSVPFRSPGFSSSEETLRISSSTSVAVSVSLSLSGSSTLTESALLSNVTDNVLLLWRRSDSDSDCCCCCCVSASGTGVGMGMGMGAWAWAWAWAAVHQLGSGGGCLDLEMRRTPPSSPSAPEDSPAPLEATEATDSPEAERGSAPIALSTPPAAACTEVAPVSVEEVAEGEEEEETAAARGTDNSMESRCVCTPPAPPTPLCSWDCSNCCCFRARTARICSMICDAKSVLPAPAPPPFSAESGAFLSGPVSASHEAAVALAVAVAVTVAVTVALAVAITVAAAVTGFSTERKSKPTVGCGGAAVGVRELRETAAPVGVRGGSSTAAEGETAPAAESACREEGLTTGNGDAGPPEAGGKEPMMFGRLRVGEKAEDAEDPTEDESWG